MKNDIQVVKIGASSIYHDGKVDQGFLDSLAYDIYRFRQESIDSALVISGSIRLGMIELGYEIQPQDDNVRVLQRLAGVGQPKLIELYSTKLKKYDIITSQVLITYHNLQDEKEEENIENRIKDDLANNIVPLVNYNDCVDDKGIVLHDSEGNLKIRDNDMLASAIAGYINASRLVILTNSNSNGTIGGRETKEKAISMANNKSIQVVVGEYSKGLYNLIQED